MVKFLRNIKVRLFLAFALFLFIPSITIGTLSYMNAAEAVKEQIIAGIDENISLLNTTIDNTIQPKIKDVDYFSETITSQLFQEENNQAIRAIFSQYDKSHEEAQSIYVGTETGLFIQEPKVKMADNYDPRKRDWYIKAMENKGEVVVSDPYVSAGTDDMVITISKMTKDGSGVTAVNIYLSYIQDLTDQVKIGKKGYALLLDKNKKFIAHPKEEGGSKAKEKFYDKMYKDENGYFEYILNSEEKMMSFNTNELTGWKLGGNVNLSEIEDAASPILKNTWIVTAAALIIGIVLIFIITISIMKPIKELQQKVLTVSRGDLTEDIQIRSNDEIGQLGKSFNTMQDSLRSLVQKVDLNAEQVTASAQQLAASSEQTSDATEYVAENIQKVANSAEQQTSEIDSNARSLDEISKGVLLITERTNKVSDLAQQTKKQAEAGGHAVTNTVNQMNSIYQSVSESNTMIKSLHESTKKVSSILDVITGIAEQTNLLSLNAAIEAARAGEQGKGFAVVADEVRKLADQSQQSVKEIDEILQRIQKDTESSVQNMDRVTDDVLEGVHISNEAIEKFNEISKSTYEITPQLEEISETIQEIAASVEEVTTTANELAYIARENATASEGVAASVEEQLASMEEITASAQELSRMAEDLKAAISQFKY
nr:methyl-accepting chemotaxis protein [uncultured Bacillus sp.]